jgi:CHAT domain-containing protein
LAYSIVYLLVASSANLERTIDHTPTQIPLRAESIQVALPPHDSVYPIIKKIFSLAQKTHIAGELPLTKELYSQAISYSINQNRGKDFWREIRQAYSYLGSISESQIDNFSAIEYYKQALEYSFMFDKDNADISYEFLINIAHNYFIIADYFKALDHYLQAESIINHKIYKGSLSYERLMNNIALCYFKLGKYSTAETYLVESIRIKKKNNDVDALATTFNNIGLIQQNNKNFKEAHKLFNNSLTIRDSMNDTKGLAFIQNNIGNLYLEEGNLDSALSVYRKAYNTRLVQAMPDSQDITVSLNNLANIFKELKNLDSATTYNDLAVAISQNVVENTNPKNALSVSNYLTAITDKIEINLIKYSTTNNYDFLIYSFSLFKPIILLITEELSKYNSLFISNKFMTENKRLFDAFIKTSTILDEAIPQQCPRSIIVSETYKTLSLLNIQAEVKKLQNYSTNVGKFYASNKLYNLQKKLSDSINVVPIEKTLGTIDSIAKLMRIVDRNHLSYHKEISSYLKSYFSNLGDSIIALSKKTKGKLYIDYYILPSAIIINLINDKGIKSYQVTYGPELIEALNIFVKSIKSLDLTEQSVQSNIVNKYLLNPIKDQLEQYNVLTFVPDGFLKEIPFEALALNSVKSDNYLVLSKVISYRFSCLNRKFLNSTSTSAYLLDFLGISPNSEQSTNDENLTESYREIHDVSDYLTKNHFHTLSLIGDEATFSNFLKSGLNAKIIHISAHTSINSNRSQLSFIDLFNHQSDTALFLPSLAFLPINCEILVLNACETERNIVDSNTGFVSFIRSTCNSQIENYICSIWKIYDNPTYHFSLIFYKYLNNGHTYMDAITHAKREMILSNTLNYPAFWAPFILYENN